MSTAVDTTAGLSVEQFKRNFLDNLRAVRGVDLDAASLVDCYHALAGTVRRYMLPSALDTRRAQVDAKGKWVYYFSAEYLLGSQLDNNLLNADLGALARQAMSELGLDFDDVRAVEIEPGLGNGGLGRLAACFLDSAATLGLPAVGYGIRYEYGIFRQTFVDGWQVERPDEWMLLGNPWELPHPELAVTVGFGGQTEAYTDERGRYRVRWRPARTILGIPYYYLVPGYHNGAINSLRLWSAQATTSFDLQIFNRGDFTRAVQDKISSETISKVLYPVDETPQGRQLRLEQQYFFVACSLHDVLRRLPDDVALDQLPERVAIQLNDTHPTVAIPELMRMLVDEYLLPWERAWEITRNVFAYTCHTLMPEALEKWPIELFERVLPRHLEIIYEINRRFLDEVRKRWPGDDDRLRRMSLIEEGQQRQVRMAFLAAVGSFKINGVAELQSGLLRDRVLRDFSELWPEKFTNVTNGVTPRRFVRLSNPQLAELLDETLGDGWLTHLDRLRGLEQHVDDAAFRRRWRAIKQHNKQQLATLIFERTGLTVSPDAMFDIMVKRLHEYKRQMLKTLHIITLYNRIKAGRGGDMVPRVFYFGAKAAPGYRMAKLIIKLINSVAAVVNHDADVGDKLRVVFLPNFNVTLAERIYPAADLSEQISTAGTEASGTGNMKFALNGAVTIGTLDGANIEIRDLVGEDNFFLFGLTEEQVTQTRAAGYHPRHYYDSNPQLKQALDQIAAGMFSPHEAELFRPLVDGLLHHDQYLVLADYQSYVDAQDRVEAVYRDTDRWTRMSILNAARCGYFSSDRSIEDYAGQIWQVEGVDVEAWRTRAAQSDGDGRRDDGDAGLDLSEAEWRLLSDAPQTVSSLLMAATDSGLIGTVLEAGAQAQAPARAARRYATNELIKAVLRRNKQQSRTFRPTYRPVARAAAAEAVRAERPNAASLQESLRLFSQIAGVVDDKLPPSQAAEFKAWLLDIGEEIAGAATEGAFSAVGGQAVGDAEVEVLRALRDALGVE